MKIYESLITVKESDLDELNHVNNVQYVQWVNDVAKLHWYENATPDMLEKYVWVVIKNTIEYKNPAFLNDIIKLRTYVTFSQGVTSTRIVEIYNNTTNILLTKAEINFCLLDAKSNRPKRITTEILNLFD